MFSFFRSLCCKKQDPITAIKTDSFKTEHFIKDIKVLPDGLVAVAFYNSPVIEFWTLTGQSHQVVGTLDTKLPVTTLALSQEGHLITGHGDKVQVWRGKQLLANIPTHHNNEYLCIAKNGNVLSYGMNYSENKPYISMLDVRSNSILAHEQVINMRVVELVNPSKFKPCDVRVLCSQSVEFDFESQGNYRHIFISDEENSKILFKFSYQPHENFPRLYACSCSYHQGIPLSNGDMLCAASRDDSQKALYRFSMQKNGTIQRTQTIPLEKLHLPLLVFPEKEHILCLAMGYNVQSKRDHWELRLVSLKTHKSVLTSITDFTSEDRISCDIMSDGNIVLANEKNVSILDYKVIKKAMQACQDTMKVILHDATDVLSDVTGIAAQYDDSLQRLSYFKADEIHNMQQDAKSVAIRVGKTLGLSRN